MSALPETVSEMVQRHHAEKLSVMRGVLDIQTVLQTGARHQVEMIRKARDLELCAEDRDADKWFAARHSAAAGGASIYCRGAKSGEELDQLVQTYAQLGMMIAQCIAQFTCGHVACNVGYLHAAIETAGLDLPEEPGASLHAPRSDKPN